MRGSIASAAGTPKVTDGGGFVPSSDTFQMAPFDVRIGIALIASNLNYRREAPRASEKESPLPSRFGIIDI